MDPAFVTALAVHYALFIWGVVTKSLHLFTSTGAPYRRVRFGHLMGNVCFYLRLVDTGKLQEMHWNINFWSDKELLAWKDSYISTCNAVSVAAAIFASIGLTALQLPDMYNCHWSARAFCIISMLLGVLSVTVSTTQQHTLAMLNDPLMIRLWLSRGRPKPDSIFDAKTVLLSRQVSVLPTLVENRTSSDYTQLDGELIHLNRNMKNKESKTVTEWVKLLRESADRKEEDKLFNLRTTWREHDKYKSLEAFKGLPLESSITIVKAVAMPRHLLDMAVYMFIVGFGLYTLFSWVENMGEQAIANRNVFIMFIIAVGSFVVYYIHILSNMVSNEEKRKQQFDLHQLGGPHRPAALVRLENELKEVQQRMKTLAEQEAQLEKQISSTFSHSHKTGRASDAAAGVSTSSNDSRPEPNQNVQVENTGQSQQDPPSSN